jgi:hypothetical protein
VVKPIVARKQLIKLTSKGGDVLSRRWSPKRGKVLDVFRELVYFTRAFPHPNLTLEVPLVEVDEYRYPGHGRRRWRHANDHLIEDQKLVSIRESYTFRTTKDLLRLIPSGLPKPFHTGHLAQALDVDRSYAQLIAYCLRNMGAMKQVGKAGNALLYRIA